MQLDGKNIVVFDLEIKNPIDGKIITWADHHKMGISVGCSYDFATRESRVFMDDNLSELAEQLNDADMVVGFNTLGFDIPLLQKTMECGIGLRSDIKHYDMLLESRLSAGWDPSKRYPTGMRLDNHLIGTFGADKVKTEDGADAPIFWQEGKLGRLISYCLADVRREADLFEFVWHNNLFITDTHGSKECLNRPMNRFAAPRK